MEILIPEIQQWGTCRKAFEKLESLLGEESHDKAGIYALVKVLQKNKEGTETFRIAYPNRYDFVQEKINYIFREDTAKAKEAVKEQEKEVLDSAPYVEGNWASCISQLKGKHLEIVSARQIAELRMNNGKNSIYCERGSWAAESFNYLPDGRILVASRDYNSLVKFAEEATGAHRAGKEFYLDDRIVELLLQGERQGGVLLLNRENVPDKIPVESFGEEPLTKFLGWGKDYGKFLSDCGISKIKLYVCDEKYAKKQGKAFSRGLLVGYLYGDSAIDGYYSLLYDGGCVFEVSRSCEQPRAARRGERSEPSEESIFAGNQDYNLSLITGGTK